MNCLICGKKYKNKNALGKHLYYSHNIHTKEYYDKYIRKPGEGICPACGKETTFRGDWSYLKFCSHKCASQNSVWNIDKYGVTKSEFYKKISLNNMEETKHRYDLKSYKRIIKILIKNKIKLLKNKQYQLFTCKCLICGNEITLSRYKIFYNNRFSMPLCYICNPKHTKREEELFKYIYEIYDGEICIKDRKVINPKELDVYIPNLKLAFEFDGTFWHMDDRIYKATDYNKKIHMTAQEIWNKDKLKDDLCKIKNVKLIHIKEYDWIKNNKNTKDFIRRKINESSNNC